MANNLSGFLKGFFIGANEEYDAKQQQAADMDKQRADNVDEWKKLIYSTQEQNAQKDLDRKNQLEVAKIRQDAETAAEEKARRYWQSYFGDNPPPSRPAPEATGKSSSIQSGTPEADLAAEVGGDTMQEGNNAAGGVTTKVPDDVAAGITGESQPIDTQDAAKAFKTPISETIKAYQNQVSTQKITSQVQQGAGDIPAMLQTNEEIAKTGVEAAKEAERLGDKPYKDMYGITPMEILQKNIVPVDKARESRTPLFYDTSIIGDMVPTAGDVANVPEYTKQASNIVNTTNFLSEAVRNDTHNLNIPSQTIFDDAVRLNVLMNTGKVIQTKTMKNGPKDVHYNIDPAKLSDIESEIIDILSKYGLDTTVLPQLFPPKKQ